jgi:hypothetical protein
MNSEGRIVDLKTGEELTMEQRLAMHNNVREQIEEPTRKKKDHIKLSTIWNTTQNIRNIQRDLVAGYSFDKDRLTEMVNAMFSFINGVAKPEVAEAAAKEAAETMHKEAMEMGGTCIDCRFSFENDNKEPACLQHKGILTQEAIAAGCDKYEKAV